jgi:hypothetical protein
MIERISGLNLARAFAGGYREKLVPELVAPGPAEAIDRIVSRFGRRPTADGGNIPGILEIRSLIGAFPAAVSLQGALMVTAPHTHWESEYPIVVRYRDGRYELLEEQPSQNRFYQPVSFVFSHDGIVPYEWADETVAMSPAELASAWQCVEWVCDKMAPQQYPLGLSLNFRFKSLLSVEIISTAEYQQDESVLHSPAVIVRAEDYEAQHPNEEMEQVAWHCRSVDSTVLEDPKADALLREITSLIENALTREERQRLQSQFLAAFEDQTAGQQEHHGLHRPKSS